MLIGKIDRMVERETEIDNRIAEEKELTSWMISNLKENIDDLAQLEMISKSPDMRRTLRRRREALMRHLPIK